MASCGWLSVFGWESGFVVYCRFYCLCQHAGTLRPEACKQIQLIMIMAILYKLSGCPLHCFLKPKASARVSSFIHSSLCGRHSHSCAYRSHYCCQSPSFPIISALIGTTYQFNLAFTSKNTRSRCVQCF